MSAATSIILTLVLALSVTLSGCVTTLGYVPEHVKPKKDTETLRATYTEVKRWAMDVLDGYDSRATMNRQSLYAGALLAAASVSALAGLAAFGSQSSALIGIPIGTGFLGTVAAFYQSEEKAAIYGRGSRYLKDIILLSDERISRNDNDVEGNIAVDEAGQAEDAAQKHLKTTKDQASAQREPADGARKVAESVKANPASTENQKRAFEKAAQWLKDLADRDQRALALAEAALKVATARRTAKLQLQKLKKDAKGNSEQLKNLKDQFLGDVPAPVELEN